MSNLFIHYKNIPSGKNVTCFDMFERVDKLRM